MKVVVVAIGALLAVGVAAPSSARLGSVAPGVTVNGVKVGGLPSEQARAIVRARFEKRLTILYDSKQWTVRPQSLGARARVDRAVRKALDASPHATVTLPVAVSRENVRTYVAYLRHKYARPAVDAHLVGTKGLSPVIADGIPGVRVATGLMEQRIEKALRSPVYRTIALATKPVSPTVTRKNFGPVVLVGRSSHRLRLFDGRRLVRQFGVATGQAAYPTPLGTYAVVTMQRDPWWIPPPNSAWAAGEKPIPPGPGNPLGTRWMGLSAPAVGIHGTPDAASIGYSASHGCIRMRVPDAEWLFEHVRVGTPVAIVDA
jgi:lipoprotein-anchoring transpeptidase ErfK/SrfK